MSPFQEILWVVARELRRSFRSARGIALSVLSALGGVAMALILAQMQRLKQHSEIADMPDPVRDRALAATYDGMYGDGILSESLLKAPFTLVSSVWFTTWLTPLLVALIGFDCISAELQHRGVRYFTVRSRRSSYFIGKALGLWLTTSLVLFGIQLITWTAAVVLREAPADVVVAWGARFLLTTLPMTLAWSSVAVFISSLIRTPMVALLAIFGTFLVMWVTNGIGLAADIEALRFAYPSGFDRFLLHPKPERIGIGLAAAAAYPLVFFAAGSALFARRDL